MISKSWKSLILLLLLVACTDEPDSTIDPAFANTNIDEEFVPYVESFLTEAALRSVDIDISSVELEIQFGEVNNTGDVIGSCNRENHHIIISRPDWDNLSNNHREVLIFHELGHCMLDRDHTTNLLSNNEVASIMWPSIQGKFFGARRSYYIDELFLDANPQPHWVFNTATYKVPFARDSIIFMDNLNSLEAEIQFDQTRDFELEFTIETLDDDRSGLSWGSEDLTTAIFVTVQKPMQVDIETGRSVFGRVYHEPFSSISDKNINKITVRKLGEDYFFFINEVFVFWMEFIPFLDNYFQTFTATKAGIVDQDANVKITNLGINYLD